MIQGPNFILRLEPWTREYRSHKIACNNLVKVDIKGIPPHAAVKDSLKTVLLPHCDIQICHFDEDTGICTTIAYAHELVAIPVSRTLGLSYRDKQIRSFPLELHTSLHNEPKKQTITQFAEDTSKGTDTTDASNNYDIGQFEDPDAVRGAFEEQCLQQDEDEEMWNRRNQRTNHRL
ncbi:unnamed protein product [Urochloa humidicola]